ncbi:MAG: hypothetical protein C0405_10945, partial [Desulfovibrio sp.]|nr:hypothetical protein [Desulfovibrio sp.]
MDATKISRRNLTAIEEGQVKLLPHPVYLKGYVRNIAAMVGLDPDELAQIVDLQCDAEQSEYISQAAHAAKGASAPVDVAQTHEAARPVEPSPHAPQPQAAPEREDRKPHAPEPLVPNKTKSGGTLRPVVALVLLVAALIALLVHFQRPGAPPEPAPAAQPAVNASREATDQGSPAGLTPLENASEALQPDSSGAPM